MRVCETSFKYLYGFLNAVNNVGFCGKTLLLKDMHLSEIVNIAFHVLCFIKYFICINKSSKQL